MLVYVCLCEEVEEERELRSQKHEQNNEKHLQSEMNSSSPSLYLSSLGTHIKGKRQRNLQMALLLIHRNTLLLTVANEIAQILI
jgi:hypothetical protein